jgi:hypothetical protein
LVEFVDLASDVQLLADDGFDVLVGRDELWNVAAFHDFAILTPNIGVVRVVFLVRCFL